jgi:thiosulfate/3-mercaptopyruvate sulfurtransferase
MLKKIDLIGSIICIAFVLGLSGTCHAAWGEKELETEKISVNLVRETVKGGYGIVTTQELKAWIDEKKPMLIVDTMPFEDSFKKQHIPGAVNLAFPIPEMTVLDNETKTAMEKLLGHDKNRRIVFYCGFVKCTRSHNGAMWAVKLGYKNVYRHPGGIKAWAEADYPVDKTK